MKGKWRQLVGLLAGAGLFALALWVLHTILRDYHYHQITRELAAIPGQNLIWAVALTLLNYLVLTGYDWLALKYIKRSLDYNRVALASFISYAFSQNLGFGILTGGSLRYRMYSAWGVSGLEITNIVAFCALTFWIGIFAVGGVVFTIVPLTLPASLHLPFDSVWPIGIVFLIISVGYLLWSILAHKPLVVRQWEFAVPPARIAVSQFVIASLDWTLAGAVLFILLPPSQSLSFLGLLGIFILAQVVGLISHVPGGLGVFEAMVLFALTPELPATKVLGSLLAFRAIYYLMPLALATGGLGVYELIRFRSGVRWLARLFGQWVPRIMPQLLAFTTFIAGIILLLSGSTPAVGVRLEWLIDFLPLPIIEISHFLGSLAGAGLLFLAWGVQRRLDAAYLLTLALLGFGIIASLLKGFDYEEAIILSVMVMAFLPCRRHFYRSSSLISERFTPGWIIAISVAIVGSVWIGLFAFKHVEYSKDLWWHFTLGGNAPRFLRASVGVISLASIIALYRLIRPAAAEPKLPEGGELEKARVVISNSRETYANLALLGDKELLFSDNGTAFIMYGIEGRSWVALGDPVGPKEQWSELVWRFGELSDRHAGWTVFYQVKAENVHLYLDLGLTLQKLGEEARVRLESFSLEALKKTMRHGYRKVSTEGALFEVIPVENVPSVMSDLKQISDSWLQDKNTREKGFSLGYFNPDYIQRFPVAVVRKDGQLLAFTNILTGADLEEMSVDLMRFLPGSPSGSMDFLFISLMLWGKAQGYRWFNLGMAPFSGLDNRAMAPLWNRMGSLLFRRGEYFYNFQGLRLYKEKFNPVWEPRYLASPAGLALPRILANIASLTSGGMKGVVIK
jgi:phosphatidylglycerol lysyltransferase